MHSRIGKFLFCAVAVVLCAHAANADDSAPTWTVRGYVVRIQENQIIVDVGRERGVAPGAAVRILRATDVITVRSKHAWLAMNAADTYA